ncbi:glycosyltransferase family 2 protein [Streptomyces beihaiensis]|uniref:Glycosyltransferase family 2 protein n=1 Tax=Streptomyces beihaiensis TaxID=2984495 RepID=A0ABT3U1Z2_9ACTN|nr:glycosyltransferase family 2 protein [Streptomyces beihaiensis]MCX3063333.1 glycosyltransferase family 2 protein [Streptomyces beihaiensis]
MAYTPDVTVTVIVHNDAERLPRAVASVLAQTHPNIEIVISDDHSTDNTPEVAQGLAASDARVTYLRLPENSGGCSAPRNRALDITSAPYVMFLDSDDELTPDAVELLLAAHRDDPSIDFAMGAVERIRVDTGRRSTWMPHLVAERRTVPGIEAEPGLLFEHLATSKMYARAFLDRHKLRFPEGIHYEDQLFSAQAYFLAAAFTVVPEPVYRWYIAPYAAESAASISNQRYKLSNVRDRVHVQELIDTFLDQRGASAALREAKDYKFLKHDFRMYAGDLPYRDNVWLAGFADIVDPYLDRLAPGAYARLPRAERVVLQLVRDRRLDDAALAARGLGHGVAPRTTVTDEAGAVYWGDTVPDTETGRRELDLSDLALDSRPFPGTQFRHEILSVERGPGPISVDLHVRTYDPALRLPVGPQVASLLLAPGRRRMSVPFRLDPVRPGVFEGRVRLDLTRAELPLQGFDGVRHPLLQLRAPEGLRNTGLLLAPLGFVTVLGQAGHHRITVEPEGRGAGRLQVRWEPLGVTARVVRPAARRVAHSPVGRRLRGVARLVRSLAR